MKKTLIILINLALFASIHAQTVTKYVVKPENTFRVDTSKKDTTDTTIN